MYTMSPIELKYADQEPLFSDEALDDLALKNKNEQTRLHYFIKQQKSVIDRGIEMGVLSEEKVNSYSLL
ncbi:MAG: hypothetical protein ACJA0Q_001363 [Saprospiraceae bacterium]